MASNLKEETDVGVSVNDKSKQDDTVQMKDVITDVPDSTDVQKKEDDKRIDKGQNIMRPGYGNIFKDGPIKLKKTGNLEKLVPGSKVIDDNNKDDTSVQYSATTQTADNVVDVVTDGSVEKPEDEIAKGHINDKPLITGRNSIGDVGNEHVESGPNKLPKTGTSAKPMSDNTPTENKGQRTSRDDSCLNSDCDFELGSDFIEECLDQGQGEVMDDPCLNREYEAEHGSDFIENV